MWLEIFWPSSDTVVAQGLFIDKTGIGRQAGMMQWSKISPEGSTSAGKMLSHDSAILSPDRQVLARRTTRSTFEFLEVATGKKFLDVPRRNLDASWISYLPRHKELFFSGDHRFFATQLLDFNGDEELSPTITLWETSTGREYYHMHVPVVLPAWPHEEKQVDQLIGLSPDGRLIATRNTKTFDISLMEHVSGQVRWRLLMPSGCISAPTVAFSPDSRLLAAGCSIGPLGEKSIHVWDLATGRECQCFHGHRAGGTYEITPTGWSPEIAFSPDGRRLASSAADYTALIWEVKPPSTPELASKPLGQEELQALKTALTGLDAVAAYQAIGKLRQVPDQAVRLAIKCLHPTPNLEVKRIAQEVGLLIGDLDSDDFQTRTKATQELRKMLSEEKGEPVVQGTLSEALSGTKLSVEVKNAISKLLSELKEQELGSARGSPELIGILRAIELLELIHNDSAQEILQQMVTAPPRPDVRGEAEAALKRLAALSSAPTKP